MPLDAAEFISELSIVDPPGTDPLNQGDDHIRTTKKAVQQSFPNVDAAVPQTAAQMAQMAIKNEVNTFTQQQLFATGSAATPSIAFADQPTTGMYRPGTSIGWAILGVNAAFLLPAQFRMIQDGNAAAPAYSFQNDTLTGMFLGGAGFLNFSASNNTNFIITPTSSSHITRLDMSEKIRFNNFNSNHGLTWRANGLLTWEFLAVHSNAPLTRLTFDRYVLGVFQDQPLQLHNDTGHVNMPVLPTTEPAGVPGSLYTQTTGQIDATERVICCSR